MKRFWVENIVPILVLFTSTGTLLCCALPALLVTLGMGAAMAGLVSQFPILITLSEHKIWVFGIAGCLIFVSAILQFIRRNTPCPVDPISAHACIKLRRVSVCVTIFSGFIYLIGFFFAFIAPNLFF